MEEVSVTLRKAQKYKTLSLISDKINIRLGTEANSANTMLAPTVDC